MTGASAAVRAIDAMQRAQAEVHSLQELHAAERAPAESS
jgi:hypothetical protein